MSGVPFARWPEFLAALRLEYLRPALARLGARLG